MPHSREVIAAPRAEYRAALVIGNGAYAGPEPWPLRNPPNDAAGMSRALTECGFEVSKHVDVDLPGMEGAVRDFMDKLKRFPDTAGLFYFAGHGIQVDGENYLVPINAEIRGWFELVRGGSWIHNAGGCRSAYRAMSFDNDRGKTIGFRVTGD